MNKTDAIQELIKKVYEYKEHLVISKKDIKKIEQYYIDCIRRYPAAAGAAVNGRSAGSAAGL